MDDLTNNPPAPQTSPQSAPANGPDASPSTSRSRWVLRISSNVAVFVVLVTIAYFGHRTDWTFGWQKSPRAMSMTDKVNADVLPGLTIEDDHDGQVLAGAEWCAAHEVAHCPVCNPQLAQLESPVRFSSEELARIRDALAMRGRSANRATCSLVHHRLRFDSSEAAQDLGVDVAPVWTEQMFEAITASGETAFDPTRVAHLTSRTSGSAWRVMKRLGQTVTQGEVLALIESPDVGKAKAEFHQAIVDWRLKKQANDNAQSAPIADAKRKEARAALHDAEARLLTAEQSLVNLDLTIHAADCRCPSSVTDIACAVTRRAVCESRPNDSVSTRRRAARSGESGKLDWIGCK